MLMIFITQDTSEMTNLKPQLSLIDTTKSFIIEEAQESVLKQLNDAFNNYEDGKETDLSKVLFDSKKTPFQNNTILNNLRQRTIKFFTELEAVKVTYQSLAKHPTLLNAFDTGLSSASEPYYGCVNVKCNYKPTNICVALSTVLTDTP